jgi:hypothetical protein
VLDFPPPCVLSPLKVSLFPAVAGCSDMLYFARFRFSAQLPPVARISFHSLCWSISCRWLVFLCVLADLSAGLLTPRAPHAIFLLDRF